MTQVSARQTQAQRRARSRNALLEAAARGLSKYGFANLALARVAGEAGYTRGALYHQFSGKEELALAVVEWIAQTWDAEVGRPAAEKAGPVEALIAVARGHAVYCRREVARVLMTLRVEFAGQDHPVGRAIGEMRERLVSDAQERIVAGRGAGVIPAGPPSRQTAQAYLGVVEAVGIQLAGQDPVDVELAERAVRGVLGLPSR